MGGGFRAKLAVIVHAKTERVIANLNAGGSAVGHVVHHFCLKLRFLAYAGEPDICPGLDIASCRRHIQIKKRLHTPAIGKLQILGEAYAKGESPDVLGYGIAI